MGSAALDIVIAEWEIIRVSLTAVGGVPSRNGACARAHVDEMVVMAGVVRGRRVIILTAW